MASTIASLIIKLFADSSTLQKGFDDAKKKSKGFLGELNSIFGKKSVLGQLGKLVVGGGAVAAISMVTKEVAAFAEDLEKLSTGWRTGGKAADEANAVFMRSIPILGNLIKAGESLKEALTGEKFWDAQVKGVNDAELAYSKWHDEIVKTIKDLQGMKTKAQQVIDVLNTAPYARPGRQIQIDTENELKKANELADAKVAEVLRSPLYATKELPQHLDKPFAAKGSLAMMDYEKREREIAAVEADNAAQRNRMLNDVREINRQRDDTVIKLQEEGNRKLAEHKVEYENKSAQAVQRGYQAAVDESNRLFDIELEHQQTLADLRNKELQRQIRDSMAATKRSDDWFDNELENQNELLTKAKDIREEMNPKLKYDRLVRDLAKLDLTPKELEFAKARLRMDIFKTPFGGSVGGSFGPHVAAGLERSAGWEPALNESKKHTKYLASIDRKLGKGGTFS